MFLSVWSGFRFDALVWFGRRQCRSCDSLSNLNWMYICGNFSIARAVALRRSKGNCWKWTNRVKRGYGSGCCAAVLEQFCCSFDDLEQVCSTAGDIRVCGLWIVGHCGVVYRRSNCG